MSKVALTIGADPEFFILNRATREPHPICGLLGGHKDAPAPMTGLPKGFFHQEDNVMAEFNIPPVNNSISAFYENIRAGLHYIMEKINKGTSMYEFSTSCEHLFPITQLKMYPNAFEFGCSPDYDGHDSGLVIPAPNTDKLTDGTGQWRFAGGHIHFGYSVDIPPFIMAQFCDLFIGLASLGYDSQKKRRALYGSPGRFRPTAYGLEYRTLSNFWLFDTSGLQSIWNGITRLEQLINRPVTQCQTLYGRIPWEDVKRAISSNDRDLGREISAYVTHEVLAEN